MKSFFMFFILIFLSSGTGAQYILEEEKEDRFKGVSDYNRNQSGGEKGKKSEGPLRRKKLRTEVQKKDRSPKTRKKRGTRAPAQVFGQQQRPASVKNPPFASCTASKKYNIRSGGVSLLVKIPLASRGKASKSFNTKSVSGVNLYKKVDARTGNDVLIVEIPAFVLYD